MLLMPPFNEVSALEVHYWFIDESHSMDATVQHRCEYEFLGIVNEISKSFGIELIVETDAFAEGGLVRRFFFLSKDQTKTLKVSIMTAVVVAVLATPVTTIVSKVAENLMEKVYEDKELKQLEKDKIKSEIEKNKAETRNLDIEAEIKQNELNKNIVIKKKRSNFYEHLQNYPKVTRLSVLTKNIYGDFHEMVVDRNEFNKFILTSDDLEPQEIDNVVIEIISPVLKKGNYKWIGIYDGVPVSFNMKSKEFKTLVQTGKIEFKNGSTINCFIQIRKKINSEGIEQTVGYDILRVNKYFENDKPIETHEGKHYRQKQESDKAQFKMNL